MDPGARARVLVQGGSRDQRAIRTLFLVVLKDDKFRGKTAQCCLPPLRGYCLRVLGVGDKALEGLHGGTECEEVGCLP